MKVLVLGPSKKTRGGITSVIDSLRQSYLWDRWGCVWIETYIDGSNFHKILYFINGLFRFLICLPGADLVHIHLSQHNSALRKSYFFRIATLLRKPVIVHLHAFSAETSIHGQRKKLYNELLTKSSAIVVLSEYWKKQIEAVTGESLNINVIYNPCPVIKPKNGKRQNLILYAGTLNERKGYKDLILSFSKIASGHKDWKVVFAGNGETDAARRLSQELNISDQVIFKGWVTGEEKQDLFEAASIFCLPSYAEGFPMAILDAMAYKIPVITTSIEGITSILSNENCILFTPGDTEALSGELERLIVSETLRDKLSGESARLAATIFSRDNTCEMINSLYEKIVASNPE